MRATVDPVDAEVRRRLDALGRRRKKLRKMQAELADDIADAIPDVKVSNLSMDEAAERLGLNRTTIYQVYMPDDNGATARAAA